MNIHAQELLYKFAAPNYARLAKRVGIGAGVLGGVGAAGYGGSQLMGGGAPGAGAGPGAGPSAGPSADPYTGGMSYLGGGPEGQMSMPPVARTGNAPGGTATYSDDGYLMRPVAINPGFNRGGREAEAASLRNHARAVRGDAQAQSYEDWSKGREGWTEDARRRRYARSAEGMLYNSRPVPLFSGY